MGSKTDEASATFIKALVPIIVWFMNRDAEDYAYSKRNTDDCWYPPSCRVMTELIPRLLQTDTTYSKQNAIADTNSAINSLFDNFKDEVPVVYQPECIVNGYNSTTMQLLVNNAYAKTVSEGAKLQLATIKDYATINVTVFGAMAQLINSIKGSYNTGNVSESYSVNTLNAITGIAELGTAIFSDNVNPNTKTPA